VVAIVVAISQLLFIFNLIYSLFRGKPSGGNPWRANSLEWLTPDTPPKHGNWGESMPVVHRWAYDYSVPGYEQDFLPQNFVDDKKAGDV
jgi:cytochrome c oxidase subunit 1